MALERDAGPTGHPAGRCLCPKSLRVKVWAILGVVVVWKVKLCLGKKLQPQERGSRMTQAHAATFSSSKARKCRREGLWGG